MNSQAERPRLAAYGPAKAKRVTEVGEITRRIQIRTPAAGAPVRTRIDVPEGFEFWKRVEFDPAQGGRIFGGRGKETRKPHPPVQKLPGGTGAEEDHGT